MSSQRAIVRGLIHRHVEERGRARERVTSRVKGKVATRENNTLETYNSFELESSGPGLRIRSHRAVTASTVLHSLLAFALLVLPLRRLQSRALD